jgi:tRNA pseudouridine13 synthase
MKFNKANTSDLTGNYRYQPEDFQVDEIAQVIPEGSGEHVWLKIRKTGENTDWVAGKLAKIANVSRKNVSYAGMKDRHAVTTQWFSVHLPGKESPDWQAGLSESIEILEASRHIRKLRRGVLQGNQFKIIIRDCAGNHAEFTHLIDMINQQGVPNYFGSQRFGHDNNNIEKARQWFNGDFSPKKRPMRSIYLSAARSWIFNQILSARIEQGNWNQAEQGDVFMLDGSNSWFNEDVTDHIRARTAEQDIHPTAALWGRGKLPTSHEIAALENSIAAKNSLLCDGLEKHGLKQERRSLRLKVTGLSARWLESTVLELSFSLPPGAYATSVLNELGSFNRDFNADSGKSQQV